jgi:hypothetical protein
MDNKEYTSTTIRKDLKKKLRAYAKSKGKLLYAVLDELVTKFLEGNK